MTVIIIDYVILGEAIIQGQFLLFLAMSGCAYYSKTDTTIRKIQKHIQCSMLSVIKSDLLNLSSFHGCNQMTVAIGKEHASCKLNSANIA